MRAQVFYLTGLLSIFFLAESLAQAQINVAVSILPQAYFAEQIGQGKVNVLAMIPPGGNPHTYEPTPGQLKRLSDSVLYIKVGAGIEFEAQWLGKISSLNQDMRIANSSKDISMIAMTSHHHDHRGHGHAHSHACGQDGLDPHVWLSPSNAIMMAINIRDALIDVDSQHEAFYRANTAHLILKLSELKQEISRELEGLERRKFFVYHPAWGYFASDFGLEQIAVESLGKDPTPRQLAQIIRRAKREKVQVVFVSPQFSQKSAQVIADEISGRVESIDPLAKDYIENLRRTARLISGKYK